MRRWILLIILWIFSFNASQAALTGGFDYAVYYAADYTPYLETYLWIEGNSIFYKNENNKKEGRIEVTVIISKKGEVVFYDKYGLKTRQYHADENTYDLIYDLKRFPAEKGTWEFEMILTDLNDPEKVPIEMRDTITIGFDENKISFSQIQLISYYQKAEAVTMFTRGGYDMIPYHSNLYEESMKKCSFYAEIYNTEKLFGPKGKFLITYYLENFETGRQLEDFTFRKRETAAPVKPILADMDITQLPNGTFNLVIEVRDSLNQFRGRIKKMIIRENRYYAFKEEDYQTVDITGTFIDRFNDKDSLREFIRCLKPIADDTEYQYGKNVMKNGDPTLMKRYIYAFWIKRNPREPQKAFADYWNEVLKVNESFSTLIQKGYETDRGRVYLKYGPPNAITQRYNEPSAYPYEIWQYWQIRAQTNVRFVFYNKDNISNDFTLLHSDLRGEINNRQWELFLFQRNNSFDVDQNNIYKQYGNWSRDLFNNPR